MGSNSTTLLQKDEVDEIARETGFTPKQIKRLYTRFNSLDKDQTGNLTKNDFSRIPELHINPLRDRIIDVIVDDNGKDGRVNFKEFAKVFSTMRRGKERSSGGGGDKQAASPLGPNSKENKLKFLFSIYDRDKDNKINKEELMAILKMLVGSNLPDGQLNAIAERTISELGSEEEMFITFEQFCHTLEKIDVDEKMSMKFLS